METLKIELISQKAYKLLQDMEELKLIRVINGKHTSQVSQLRKRIKNPMTEQQIETQMKALRTEWGRDIY